MYAQLSPTLATITSHPTTSTIVAVVPLCLNLRLHSALMSTNPACRACAKKGGVKGGVLGHDGLTHSILIPPLNQQIRPANIARRMEAAHMRRGEQAAQEQQKA